MMDSDSSKEIIIRLDERTKAIQEDINQIKKDLEKNYVTMNEFKPVRMIVYGLAGAILIGFFSAVLALILYHPR